MVLGDGHGTPMVAATASASVHEVKLIEPLVKQVRDQKVMKLLLEKLKIYGRND